VKARGGDPAHQPRGQHRQEAAAFKKTWTFLSLARPMTVASCCVRPAVRASAKAASTVPEIIAGRDRAQQR
jgi:hypothetical protein